MKYLILMVSLFVSNLSFAGVGQDPSAPMVCEDRSIMRLEPGSTATIPSLNLTVDREKEKTDLHVDTQSGIICTVSVRKSDRDRPRHIRRESLTLEVTRVNGSAIQFSVIGGDPTIESVRCFHAFRHSMTIAQLNEAMKGRLAVVALSKSFCESPIDALNLGGRVPADSRISLGAERQAESQETSPHRTSRQQTPSTRAL